MPRTPTAYIYFLFLEDSLVYVGRTTNLRRRAGQHRIKKDFNRCTFLRVPAEDQYDAEAYFIDKYKPGLNGGSSPKGYDMRDIERKLSLDLVSPTGLTDIKEDEEQIPCRRGRVPMYEQELIIRNQELGVPELSRRFRRTPRSVERIIADAKWRHEQRAAERLAADSAAEAVDSTPLPESAFGFHATFGVWL